MATPPRAFAKDAIYHVYNRGNRKQEIFRETKNYLRFIARTKLYVAQSNIAVFSYCLIPNHYHLLVRQQSDLPLSHFLLRLQTSYARYINVKYRETGHLFEQRFQACLVTDDAYLLHLVRYIHLNPAQHLRSISAAIRLARSYPWSSCAAYFGEREDPLVAHETVREFLPPDLFGKQHERFLRLGPWPPPEPADETMTARVIPGGGALSLRRS